MSRHTNLTRILTVLSGIGALSLTGDSSSATPPVRGTDIAITHQDEGPDGTGNAATTDLYIPPERLTWHVPDPEAFWVDAQDELEQARRELEESRPRL